jgi:hypothetical protein
MKAQKRGNQVGKRARPGKGMAAKTESDGGAKPAASYKNAAISVVTGSADPKEFAGAVARKLTKPEVSAAGVIEVWQRDTHDVNELVIELSRQVDAVNSGDLKRAEAILVSQSHALDNIFANLARRAVNQEYLKQWETYMRMAMRAQSQCRMTLETLAALKNPQVVFAKQANINNGGQQQVNNGAAGSEPTPARAVEIISLPNGLLEETHVERLDAGTQGATGSTHHDLAPVGVSDRTTERDR